jgi:gluconolactonase
MSISNAKLPGMVCLVAGLLATNAWCADETAAEPTQPKTYPTFGKVERLDPAIDALIPQGAQLEKLAGGFEWSEGPVWDGARQSLFFSDVPRNVIFQWKESMGTRDYLYPSGYTGSTPRAGELGSNGLTFDDQGRLIICQHGDRRVARLEKDGSFTTLARLWNLRRFNSPNDLVYDSKGNLYFTDPCYGLEGKGRDPLREIVFSGVYLLRPSGEVVLLKRDLTQPNGVAFSPDQKTLYVAVSDASKPHIMAYPVNDDGTLGGGALFFDATPLRTAGRAGSTDGLKVDVNGNVFSTGPGGVLVLSPEGRHLGTILTGEATANCAWGGDGSVLYITADMYLCRIQTSTKGSNLPGKRR